MTGTKRPHTEFTMTFGRSGSEQDTKEQVKPESSSSATFHVAILGDFSGRENQARHEPATIRKRRFIEVDRDNLENTLEKFDIELQLTFSQEQQIPLTVPIKSFDDFHPDKILTNVAVFEKLRQLRRRLQNTNTFSAAATEMQGWLIPPPQSQTTTATAMAMPIDGSLLDTVMSTTQVIDADARSRSGSEMVDRLIRQVVAPYVEASPDPRQHELVAAVDQAMAMQMRQILHHPDFQALEAAWLSVEFLVNRVETSPSTKLFLLDITKAELDSDLAVNDITQSGMYHLFADAVPGILRFGMLLGNYQFNPTVEDILLLAQLGEIAQRADAPFVAAAHEQFAGCESFGTTPDVDDWAYSLRDGVKQAWAMLRTSPVAEKLALTAPRFLLRLPYGKKSRPVDNFVFEELIDPHNHRCYLWGNGAFVKAEQLIHAITEETVVTETTRLPLYMYDDEGERVSKACAEIYLTDRGGRRIRENGLLPLWSVKHSDTIRSSDFCSIATSGKSI